MLLGLEETSALHTREKYKTKGGWRTGSLFIKCLLFMFIPRVYSLWGNFSRYIISYFHVIMPVLLLLLRLKLCRRVFMYAQCVPYRSASVSFMCLFK